MKGTTRAKFDAGTALLYEAEKDLEKGISEGGKIFLEISDLTEIERRPGPDLTLHDAEDAKADDLGEQVRSKLQLHWTVTATRQ